MCQTRKNEYEAFARKLENMLGRMIQCYTYICRLIQLKKNNFKNYMLNTQQCNIEKHKENITHSPRTSDNYGYYFGVSSLFFYAYKFTRKSLSYEDHTLTV